jgi:hypothetical protein
MGHHRAMTRTILAALLTVFFTAAHAADSWVQYVAGGGVEVRAVLPDGASTCPSADIDGKASPMAVRAPADPKFPLTCSLAIPPGTRALSVDGRALPVPAADPQRIMVFGDTGCRIKGKVTQACNDPKAWPFAAIATAAAALKPELVIHVGDYLYRESPCPNAGCAGSPFGDNWQAWDADFFAPAAPLLAAAPWIFVRGNHEDCQRSGAGWLRLLGPLAFDPAAPCTEHLPPWLAKIGSEALVVMDDADAPDTVVDPKLVPVYAQDFATVKTLAGSGPVWLAMHRPIWAAITGPLGLSVGGSATLIAASGDLTEFQPVSLLLSGHIHSFEAVNYDKKIPPQVVAGFGGDNLDVTPANLRGTIFQGSSGVTVKDGLSIGGFGFLMMTRNGTGWDIQLYDATGAPTHRCQFAGGRVDCPASK